MVYANKVRYSRFETTEEQFKTIKTIIQSSSQCFIAFSRF